MDSAQWFSIVTLVLGAALGYVTQYFTRRSEHTRQDALRSRELAERRADEEAARRVEQRLRDREVVLQAMEDLHTLVTESILFNSVRKRSPDRVSDLQAMDAATVRYAEYLRRSSLTVVVLASIDSELADAAEKLRRVVTSLETDQSSDLVPAALTEFDRVVVRWLRGVRFPESQSSPGASSEGVHAGTTSAQTATNETHIERNGTHETGDASN